MSVNASYRRITARELAELRRDPELVDAFFGNFDFDDFQSDEELDAAIIAFQDDLEASSRYLDIMNEHQALNFLLTGQAEGGSPPLGAVVEGGTVIGDADVGYGPPHFLTPNEVQDIALALKGVTVDEIRARFDSSAMNEAEVYPARRQTLSGSGWREGDREGLVELFHSVKSLFLDAAQEGDAVLFWYH